MANLCDISNGGIYPVRPAGPVVLFIGYDTNPFYFVRYNMKYKSDILETIHENATANFEIGAISGERMREYDEMCLTEDPKRTQGNVIPEEIKHIDLVTA